MKKFFNITEPYQFEIYDFTTIITIINVILVLCGVHYAPIFGLFNCGIFIILNIITHAHINSYVTQIMLIVLNSYFLTL